MRVRVKLSEAVGESKDTYENACNKRNVLYTFVYVRISKYKTKSI